MTFAPTRQEVLDALAEGVAIVEPGGRVVEANRALRGWLGEGLVGRVFVEAFGAGAVADAVRAALAGTPSRCELELARRRTLAVEVAPLGAGALLTVRDVTRAERLETAKRDFVSNASHELRTPVTAIRGAAETLLAGAVDDPREARPFVEIVSRHAERLAALTSDLLDLSRIEAGEWRFQPERLPLGALVPKAIQLVQQQAADKRMTLEDATDPALHVRADAHATEQVLFNLLENAVKHTPAGGTIRVEALARGALVELAVQDTGPGIAEKHLARLFERFYRVDKGRSREVGGTGLGLSIVKHLVEEQGGAVGVESGPGGSRFWFRLPTG